MDLAPLHHSADSAGDWDTASTMIVIAVVVLLAVIGFVVWRIVQNRRLLEE